METKYPLNYTYCWFCVHNTLHCPECGTNACSCGCGKREEIDGKTVWLECTQDDWWKWTDEAYEAGLIPDYPTREEVEKKLDWIDRIVEDRLTEEEKILRFFDHYHLSDHEKVCRFAKMYGLRTYPFYTIYYKIKKLDPLNNGPFEEHIEWQLRIREAYRKM